MVKVKAESNLLSAFFIYRLARISSSWLRVTTPLSLHDARIDLDSTLGKGTTIRVSFPNERGK